MSGRRRSNWGYVTPLLGGLGLGGLAIVLWPLVEEVPVSRLTVGMIAFAIGALLELAYIRQWRGVGIVTGVVGLSCAALIVAHDHVPREWNPVILVFGEGSYRPTPPDDRTAGRTRPEPPRRPSPAIPDIPGPGPDAPPREDEGEGRRGLPFDIIRGSRADSERIDESDVLEMSGLTIRYRHSALLPGACPGPVEAVGNFGGRAVEASCVDEDWLELDLRPLLDEGELEAGALYCVAFRDPAGRVGDHSRIAQRSSSALAANGRVAFQVRRRLLLGPQVVPVLDADRRC